MDRKKQAASPYPTELRERAVQMVVDHLYGCRSLTAAVGQGQPRYSTVTDFARFLG